LRSCPSVSIFLSSERCNEGESRCPRSEAARTHRELLEGKVDRPGAASARRPSLAFPSLIASYTSHPPVRSQPKGAQMPVLSGADPAGSAGVGETADRLWQQLLRQPQHN